MLSPWELEQPGLEPVLKQDANTARGGLTFRTRKLAPLSLKNVLVAKRVPMPARLSCHGSSRHTLAGSCEGCRAGALPYTWKPSWSSAGVSLTLSQLSATACGE